MDRSWIFDSSPLIVLGKAGRLSLLSSLPCRLLVPRSVKREVLAVRPADATSAWLTGRNCPIKEIHAAASSSVLPWSLGAGETAVLSAALERMGSTAVLDDRYARRCAESLSIKIVGTIGLLLWLKSHGSLDKVKPTLDSIRRAGFRLEEGLYKHALGLAGEAGSGSTSGPHHEAREKHAAYSTRTGNPGRKRRRKRK